MQTRVLFLCSNGTVQGPMAVSCARHARHANIEAACAGISAGAPDPLVAATLRRAGLPADDLQALTIEDLSARVFDIVVFMSPTAARQAPLLPGCPVSVRWDLPEPETLPPSHPERTPALAALLDRIRPHVAILLEQGYLEALNQSRCSQNLILESISDGVLAHDLNRRLVFFNRAAETITGFNRRDILGRDCHAVFDGNFCGGKCLFCDTPPPDFDERRQSMQIYTRNGETRTVDATLRPLRDSAHERIGVVMSFHDRTREVDLARRIGDIQSFAGIMGRDARMQAVFDLIRDVADATVPVLIRGESGTGKELVAAAIHNESLRAAKLFVPVNCGALPEGLLESELFGHVKGAFTGAIRDKKGRFELADGGTIFLDEIGDISPAMQIRLLRVLQEGTFERVGGEHTLQVNVRVISATHRDLQQEIAAGKFREDLYYRLNVVPIHLPPLRQRPVDIPMLTEHFLKRYAREQGRNDVRISNEALDVLLDHDWPGNVRELQNWIQFALVKCRNTVILPQHFPPHTRETPPLPAPVPTLYPRGRQRLTTERVHQALQEQGGNRGLAAQQLGVSRATLYRFFSRHPDIFIPD